MRMESCHIDHFGKIEDFSYNFSAGLNVILEDNAWGKTTFSDFIKAMFYGLEYNTKRINERKRYDPWKGGTFGGSLTFETKGKRYRIERTFGKKDKEDTFALFDLDTGKPSDAYGSDIGGELFKIDRESFAKSIYVPQSRAETEMTDSLNAKIGNLSQAKDDISNYEKVMDRLEEKKKEYESRSKKSRVQVINSDLSALKKKKKEGETLSADAENIERHIAEKKRELKSKRDERDECGKMLVLKNEHAQKSALCRDAEESQKKYEENMLLIRKRYGGREIGPDDEKAVRTRQEAVRDLEKRIEYLAITREMEDKYEAGRRLFCENLPDGEFFKKQRGRLDRAARYNEAAKAAEISAEEKSRLRELKDIFGNSVPSAEDVAKRIEAYREAENIKKEIDEYKIKKAETDNEAARKSRAPMFAVPGAVLLAAAVFMLVFSLVPAFGAAFISVRTVVITAVVAALFIAAGALIVRAVLLWKKDIARKAKLSRESEDLSEKISKSKEELCGLEERCNGFIRRYRTDGAGADTLDQLFYLKEKQKEAEQLYELLRKKRESAKAAKEQAREILLDFSGDMRPFEADDKLFNAGVCDSPESIDETVEKYAEELDALNERARDYAPLEAKVLEYRKLTEELKTRRMKLEEISRLYTPDALDCEAFYKDCGEYARLKSAAKAAKERAAKLKGELASDGVADDTPVFQLQDKSGRLDEEIRQLTEEISRYERDLERMYVQIEELDGIDAEIEKKSEELADCRRKYEILNQTAEYLKAAKERFSARYLKPMRDAFSGYLRLINDIDRANIPAEDIDIDIDLSATVRGGSLSHGAQSLSRGYQDLVYLCIRFALLDVMYPDESPVVILDDPFVNLDPAKIKNALEIVRDLAGRYQIVYFTCHPSRARGAE